MATLNRKPKVRAPRRGNPLQPGTELDFEESWTVLANALHDMHMKQAGHLSYEQTYRSAYKIVLKKKGNELYDRLQQFEQQWLGDHVLQVLRNQLARSLIDRNASTTTSVNDIRVAGERFMRALKEAFEEHQTVMNLSTDVFMYLDKVQLAEAKRPSIYTSGMMQFKNSILFAQELPGQLGRANLLHILKTVILDQIAMERDGDVIDDGLIKGCVNMLESLYDTPNEGEDERLYLTGFEKDYLTASRKFYQAEATRLLAEADAASYCRQTIRRIKQEQDRCRSTLSPSTELKIVQVIEDELIKNKIKELIYMDSGVWHMIDNDRYQELGMIFDLNARVDEKKADITAAIQEQVKSLGEKINAAAAQAAKALREPSEKAETGEQRPNINQQTEAALKWVDDILTLKDKYDHLWRVSFQSDPIIQPALTRTFSESINSFSRSSEFMSLFIDENMKKGLKDKTEAEVEKVLDKAIALLRYIQDKDMFERYYKKHLSKRLLMNKSVSIDVEKQMISRMKLELGNAFTSKIEAMFKDMAISAELTSSYSEHVQQSADAKRIELSVNVLTSMTWPLESMQAVVHDQNSRSKCIFPSSIDMIKAGFENFYKQKHSGRLLTWMGNMGSADIRVTFPKVPGKEDDRRLGRERRHEINVSTYAMIILLLFNDLPDGTSLTFDEIQTKTNIGTNELIRNLQSLSVAPKTRILTKEPMSKDIKPTDRFAFNIAFSSPFTKIKVGVVAAGNKVESSAEREETEKKNDASRKFLIEAAIVRIMKARKELRHQQLISETVTVLASQFKPEIPMIKAAIESLIEREYLERVEGSDPAAYRYLA